jgi:hypothetical protein
LGQETPSPPVKGKKKSLAIVAATLIAVIVIVSAVYWFVVMPSAIPWLFKGAYAKYHGETIVLFVPVKLDMRLEVLDYNSTHAKLLMYTLMSTPLGSREFQNITWSDLTKKSYEIEGATLKRSYEQETYIEGLGTRKCTVYEYEFTPGNLIIVFIDKETAWPIKMTFTTEATQSMPGLSIDLKIVESNIPGLKK